MIRTSHIRSMLAQAIDACERAEEIGLNLDQIINKDDAVEDIQRLLQGAVFNAQHAAAEIQDERFRFKYGSDGYVR